MLLAAVAGVLMVTLFLVLRREPEEEKMSAGWCGVRSPPPGDKSEEYARGKDLFIQNCAACHNKNMKDNLTGPALGGVENRWSKFPRKDLYNYIRHSQAMTKAKHPRAHQLWKEWKPAIMNDFSPLTDQEIENLLYYIRAQQVQYSNR